MKNTDTKDFLHHVFNIDLNDYFKSQGMAPIKTVNNITYYPSPFHGEAPMEVHGKSKWYDQATGPSLKQILEFGKLYHKYSIPEFLTALGTGYSFPNPDPIHPQFRLATEKPFGSLLPLVGERNLPLRDEDFQYIERVYLAPKETAIQYLNRVELSGVPGITSGIAFLNDKDGIHISYGEGKSFTHGAYSPTTFDHGSRYVDVFRSINDMMALQLLRGTPEKQPNNAVVLNKLFLFEDARAYLEQHEQVNLYLDHHGYSKEVVGYADWLDNKKYRDFSQPYKNDHSLTNVLRKKLMHLEQIEIKISRKKGPIR